MDNLKAKKRHPEEIAVYTAIYVCAAFSVLLLLGIIIYVFAKGARRVNWAFLTGVTSILHGTVGIAGNILNTLIIILLTMIITTPIGVGAAIYLNEYAKPGKLVTVIIFATETLAGIPSIIFGLFGVLHPQTYYFVPSVMLSPGQPASFLHHFFSGFFLSASFLLFPVTAEAFPLY